MRTLFIVLLFVILSFLVAIAHEADLSNNFKRCGDAKAFFFSIKIEDYNKTKKD